MTTSVVALKREASGTRVRLHRPGSLVDKSWRAELQTRPGHDRCVIVAFDFKELECVTTLGPESIVGADGAPLQVTLVPPQELVDRVEEIRRNWRDDVRPPPDWPDRP